MGQHEAALADYDKAIDLKPDYADAYSNRGVAKAALGQHDNALDDYDRAIDLKPDDADAYNNRGAMRRLRWANTMTLSPTMTGQSA